MKANHLALYILLIIIISLLSKINKKIDDIWNWSGSLVDQSEEINRTLGFFYSDYSDNN
jgi:hypothetical protein